MTLSEAVQAKVAEWQPAAGRQDLTVPDEGSGWAVRLTADRNDAVGCLVWEAGLRRTAADEGGATLRSRAPRRRAGDGPARPPGRGRVGRGRGEALLRSKKP